MQARSTLLAKFGQDEKHKGCKIAMIMTDLKRDYSLGQLVGYFLKLGSIGFGGPVVLVGYMHRDLVEKKKWITEETTKRAWRLLNWRPDH